MDYVKDSIHSIRNLRSWILFDSQFAQSVIEHKWRNNSQFLNVLEQLWGTEKVLCHLLSRTLPEAHRPLLRELDDVIGKAIALVEVCFRSEISPEYHSVEHYLEVFTELRWWTCVVVCVVDDIFIRTTLYSFATPKGVSEPASSRLGRFVQKLYLWWSGSDGYLRHLPSYGIEVFLQKTSNLFEWLKTKNCERLSNEFDINGMEYVIEGTVTLPALGAHKPPRVKDRKVDLTQAVLGVSHSALVVKCDDPGTKKYALKRVNCLEQKQPILARLAHPHVVRLLDFWRENGFLFLAMELMEGDLAELTSRRLKKSKMPFTIDVAVDLMLQVAKTMLYLHDLGLAHPHLKSSDVLFREANDHAKLGKNEAPRYLLKLGDFRFNPKNDFESLARQNVYQFGLICVEILFTKPLQWTFEERIQGMSEEPKRCFDAIRDGPESLVPELLAKCIEKCLDGNTQFSEVVVMLLLAQLEVVRTKATKESSTTYSDGEQLLQQDVSSGLKSSRFFGISRAKCKFNVAGRECKCQEWEPSKEDESLCDCCEHHISFHESLHPITSGYGRCVQGFGDAECLHKDGCQEYFPPSASNEKICAGCGCHRNYHKKIVGVGELAGPSNAGIQQDSMCSNPSTTLIQRSCKEIKLDPAINIPTEVDSGHEPPTECGLDLNHELDIVDMDNTAFGDGTLRHEGSAMHDETTDRHILEPKHKVFLSHSGAQKDFAEQLYVDLERCDRYPFFDKRSLRKGVNFVRLIFKAIQQCEVGVAILSEEYFTHKHPMLELVEMVRASRRRPDMRILPVYLSFSPRELYNSDRLKRWITQWEKWATVDKNINIDEWKVALKILKSINGLQFNDGEVPLREKIVTVVCDLVLPEILWDDSNVQGRDRLCQVILEKVDLDMKDQKSKVCVVGLYGMSGIGKTTICKVLCNKLLKKFQGKVCHMELKSASEVELLQKALKNLTDGRLELIKSLDIDQCKSFLRARIGRQPIFLAIDNVDEESTEQAQAYLRLSFGNGSLVVVTARSLDQLKPLNIREDNCLEMPELEELEARILFKNFAANICDEDKLDDDIVTHCIQMCRLKKGDGVSDYYNPLALKVLGNGLSEQMACYNYDPKLWNLTLLKIKKSYEIVQPKEHIFSILRTWYDTISQAEQMFFGDVVLFLEQSMVLGLKAYRPSWTKIV